jgi:16S rRNA processing protein RimM
VLKPGLAIVTAPEIESREDAAALAGERFYVDRDALPATDADEFYMEDLVGLAVVDDQSAPLGRIVGVHNFGAGDILEIGERPGGAGTLFAPFTRTAFPAVDLRRRVVVAVLATIQADDGDGEEAALVTESMRQEDA